MRFRFGKSGILFIKVFSILASKHIYSSSLVGDFMKQIHCNAALFPKRNWFTCLKFPVEWYTSFPRSIKLSEFYILLRGQMYYIQLKLNKIGNRYSLNGTFT